MANYVVNKIICTEEILNKYFIDYCPIDENEKLEEPYISFNKLFGVKTLNEYAEKYGEYIYYGYGFSYEKNEEGLIEIKFLTRYLYPISAIVKAVEMFKENLIWYSCEENKIYLSEFFWNGKKVQENTLYIENTEYNEWVNENEDYIEAIEYPDDEIWHYDLKNRSDWRNWESDNLIQRYFNRYPSEEYYNQMHCNTSSKEKTKKIIFYDLKGNIKKEEVLTKENLVHINGMMTKCYMIDGKVQVGYADFGVISDRKKNDRSIHDDIYLWTWDNLDEKTGKLIGNDDEKFNQTFKEIKIDEVEKVETILYSNPRWGGKLTNKFEFRKEGNNLEKLEIPSFLQNNKQENEKKYYFLFVKYDDCDGYCKEYNYISNDLTIKVGDRVLVDRMGNLAVATVENVGFYNELNAPYPVDMTKSIIKKVDDDFELDDLDFYDEENEYDEEFEDEGTLNINIEDTYFKFGVSNYLQGKDNDDNWTKIKLIIKNRYFNYYKNSELMTSAELERLLGMLEGLLEGKINKKEKIEFYEPDLTFELYPKLNLWKTGKFTYIKKGYEIQDIYMELHIHLQDNDGAYICQEYIVTFDREEIEKIKEYIKRKMQMND